MPEEFDVEAEVKLFRQLASDMLHHIVYEHLTPMTAALRLSDEEFLAKDQMLEWYQHAGSVEEEVHKLSGAMAGFGQLYLMRTGHEPTVVVAPLDDMIDAHGRLMQEAIQPIVDKAISEYSQSTTEGGYL